MLSELNRGGTRVARVGLAAALLFALVVRLGLAPAALPSVPGLVHLCGGGVMLVLGTVDGPAPDAAGIEPCPVFGLAAGLPPPEPLAAPAPVAFARPALPRAVAQRRHVPPSTLARPRAPPAVPA